MSIQVVSTSAPLAASTADAKDAATKSEPVAQKAAEQNASEASDTSETEAGEESDESEESESDEETDAKDEAKDKPKKKSGAQRRKERAERAEAEAARARADADHWRTLALKNAGDSGSEKKAQTEEPAAADGKPKPDDFETHAEYVEALTDWKTEQKLNERDQKLEKRKLEIEQEKVLKSHSDRVKTFADKTDDFFDVVSSVDDVPVSAVVQEIIVSSENGPELMYELAKNREEYARICKLSPLAAARELGRLESKLTVQASEEKKPETKKITKAPKPLEPVGKGSASSVEKSLDDPSLSQAEYERIRREQMRRKQA